MEQMKEQRKMLKQQLAAKDRLSGRRSNDARLTQMEQMKEQRDMLEQQLAAKDRQMEQRLELAPKTRG